MSALLREIRIPTDTRRLLEVRTFVEGCLRELPASPREPIPIVLAVDEAVTNVIEHGYGGDGSGEVRIQLRGDAEKLEVLVEDRGKAFDPTRVPVPDIAIHVRQGRRKGLGIFLMRRIMDEVQYRFEPGEPNRLRMVKFFRPPSDPRT